MRGMKPNQKDSHISKYCERPGGGEEHVSVAAKVQAWVMTELPKRPNDEDPKTVQTKERRRQRSQSRQRDQRPQIAQSEGFDVWQYGKDLENQRRYVLKALKLSQKRTY